MVVDTDSQGPVRTDEKRASNRAQACRSQPTRHGHASIENRLSSQDVNTLCSAKCIRFFNHTCMRLYRGAPRGSQLLGAVLTQCNGGSAADKHRRLSDALKISRCAEGGDKSDVAESNKLSFAHREHEKTRLCGKDAADFTRE